MEPQALIVAIVWRKEVLQSAKAPEKVFIPLKGSRNCNLMSRCPETVAEDSRGIILHLTT